MTNEFEALFWQEPNPFDGDFCTIIEEGVDWVKISENEWRDLNAMHLGMSV